MNCGSVIGGDCTNQAKMSINMSEGNTPYKCSLVAEQPLEIKNGSLFGYFQFDMEVPENLRAIFVKFPPIFQNTLVS